MSPFESAFPFYLFSYILLPSLKYHSCQVVSNSCQHLDCHPHRTDDIVLGIPPQNHTLHEIALIREECHNIQRLCRLKALLWCFISWLDDMRLFYIASTSVTLDHRSHIVCAMSTSILLFPAVCARSGEGHDSALLNTTSYTVSTPFV